jgi:hypothetical protein
MNPQPCSGDILRPKPSQTMPPRRGSMVLLGMVLQRLRTYGAFLKWRGTDVRVLAPMRGPEGGALEQRQADIDSEKA